MQSEITNWLPCLRHKREGSEERREGRAAGNQRERAKSINGNDATAGMAKQVVSSVLADKQEETISISFFFKLACHVTNLLRW